MNPLRMGNVVEYRIGGETGIGVLYGCLGGKPPAYYGMTMTGDEWISDDIEYVANSLSEYVRSGDNAISEVAI